MVKKKRDTKDKIISAAWRLFYEQGYSDTTVEEIIEESATSKGSFYHYFSGKDAILETLSTIFDKKYEELSESIDRDMDAFDKLMFLNKELFLMIEDEIAIDLIARLYSSQLVTNESKHLLDHNRFYYKLLRKIVQEGQKNGQLKKDVTGNEIVKLYALCERAFIYDWCLCNGEYSLSKYSSEILPGIMNRFRV